MPSTTPELLERVGSPDPEVRRAALVILGTRPFGDWAEAALTRRPDEAACLLFRLGYRRPGPDPFAYLGVEDRLQRPWTHGLGLHLDGHGSWRFQWIPSPSLMGSIRIESEISPALARAPQPSVLLHLRRLRPGLEQLRALGGGPEGLGRTLAQGSRLGFLLSHVEMWLDKGGPGLEPLADREAWVFHFGRAAGDLGPQRGTLVYLPGELPTRVGLALGLLKLNPFSRGVRSRTEHWRGPGGAEAEVTHLRGAGGVLHLYRDAAGTWISDREAPLRSLLFPDGGAYLGERSSWCAVAFAGRRPETAVSFWVIPRTSQGDAFERAAMVRRRGQAQQPTWTNPFIAKAAPRTGALSVSLGAGPTEIALRTLLRVDHPFPLRDTDLPAFTDQGRQLTDAQRRQAQAALQANRSRRGARDQVRASLQRLVGLLDLRGVSLVMDGFVPAPPLNAAQRQTLVEYRRLRRTDWEKAEALVNQGRLGFLGGFTEPGFAPSLALAVPIAQGQETTVQQLLDGLWPKLYRGRLQEQDHAGAKLKRVRTGQALNPTFVVTEGHLVLGTDEAPVKAVVAGLRGQAPTLADWQNTLFGRGEVDGERAARDLETLLLAYLRSHGQGGPWWEVSTPTEDDARAELAATFGPFLGAIRALGRRGLDLAWTTAGLEVTPR